MKIFSKLKEYNKLLEKVLENKYFSSNIKNLLLNMIYKIENSYNDYYEVKRIKKSKEEFIMELIESIENYVHHIEIVEPKSEKSRILQDNFVLGITNEKSGNILTYPTEMAMLYSIADIKPKFFYINDEFLFKNGIQKMLVFGYNKNSLEILTDFNGWSWHIDNKYNNYIYNLIYQNFLILLGVEFLDKWMNCNSSKIDFIEEIKKISKDTKYFFWICRIIYLLEKEDDCFIKKINLKVKEFNKITDKDEYLEEIKTKKLKLTKAVEKIDIILNDEKTLIKEFKNKNKNLEDKKKIKDIKSYKKLLENDRKNFIQKIRQMSNLLIPKNFLKLKEELELYNKVTIEEADLEGSILESQKEFIRIMMKKFNKITTKDLLIDAIYQIRYYKNIFLKDKQKIKDYIPLNNKIENLEKKIITLACKNAILRIFSMDINLNFDIIKNILDTNIIELQEIRIKLNCDKGNLNIEIYDKEVFERKVNIKCNCKKEDLEIKNNKSITLFV